MNSALCGAASSVGKTDTKQGPVSKSTIHSGKCYGEGLKEMKEAALQKSRPRCKPQLTPHHCLWLGKVILPS